MDAPGMAAEPQPRWIDPPQADVDRKHILVNLDCDNIIGARFIEIVVEFFSIKRANAAASQCGVRQASAGPCAGPMTYYVFDQGWQRQEPTIDDKPQGLSLQRKQHLTWRQSSETSS